MLLSERQDVIERINESESIYSDNIFTYKLTHYYDQEPRIFYFKSNIQPEVMDALIAFIQFEMSENEMEYSMDQTEVIDILKELYQASDSKRGKNMTHFDLYWNWEKWCGVADQLKSIKAFQRDGLKERLKEMFNVTKRKEVV